MGRCAVIGPEVVRYEEDDGAGEPRTPAGRDPMISPRPARYHRAPAEAVRAWREETRVQTAA
jgi:hypothetical protein